MGRAGSVLLAALLAACGGTPSAEQPGASGSSPGSPLAAQTPRVTPSSSPAVADRFVFDKDAVVDTKLAGTNDRYINPGAVIEKDGVLHMFPNSFSKWPGRMLIPHLTSTDGGATWTLDKKSKPIDSTTGFNLANPGIDVSTGFIADDGTWVLIYETVATSVPWVVARATAPAPEGPWTVDDSPIVEPGPAGAPDQGGIEWPSVVRVGNRWAMYYAAVDQPMQGTGSIGVAFSHDGKTWTKADAPVLSATEPWEGRTVGRPRVVATANGYAMVYVGRKLTDRGLATSTDGLRWTKIPGPNLERKDFPVSEPGSWDSALVYRDGQLVYLLEIGGETTKIYRATLSWP